LFQRRKIKKQKIEARKAWVSAIIAKKMENIIDLETPTERGLETIKLLERIQSNEAALMTRRKIFLDDLKTKERSLGYFFNFFTNRNIEGRRLSALNRNLPITKHIVDARKKLIAYTQLQTQQIEARQARITGEPTKPIVH